MSYDSRLEWTKLAVTAVGGTIAVGIGLYQYVTTSSQTARQPFLEKQTELCFKASETVARIATTDDPAEWKKSREEFWVLYWGPLAIVEDKAPGKSPEYSIVSQRMIEFGNKINEIQDPLTHLPATELTRSAIQVSKACQNLETSWWDTAMLGIAGSK